MLLERAISLKTFNNDMICYMKNYKHNILFFGMAVALAGCMVGPDYVEPSVGALESDLKAEHFFRDEGLWKEAVPADSLPKGDWWSVFGDAQLDSLLKQCRENNPNLSAAFYRVEQARENARMEKSQLYPWLSGNGSFETVNPSKNVAQSSGSYEKWTTGFGLTWDLDLFGRIRSILEADIADAQAELDAYNNLILSMQTSVANSYFTIRQYRSEIELLDRTLNVRKEQTDLVRRRVELDFASELDLQRAIQQECDAAAQLAALQRSLALEKNNIAILVGTTPSKLNIKIEPLGEVLPKLPAAVPSQLLERRPDIAAAERAVYAANARIGAAHAGYFPTVSISANTDLSANKIEKLVNSSSFAWGISPQIYIPIFQAGRTYAQKQVALAAHKETLENYKAVVLNAIGEVENALSEINNLRVEYKKRIDVTNASLKVQELTIRQYELGFVDYFSVSDAQRQALIDEREQIALRGSRFRACVNLIAAIGGGWQLNDEEQREALEPKLEDNLLVYPQ